MGLKGGPKNLKNKWSLLACTPKGLHAPRYKIWFQGYPYFLPLKHFFYRERPTSYRLRKKQIIFGDVYRNRQRGVARPDTHITLTRVSCSIPTPSSNFGWGYGGHISLAETYPIPEVSSAEADQGACPLVFSHAP